MDLRTHQLLTQKTALDSFGLNSGREVYNTGYNGKGIRFDSLGKFSNCFLIKMWQDPSRLRELQTAWQVDPRGSLGLFARRVGFCLGRDVCCGGWVKRSCAWPVKVWVLN
jgi:hypothetical protein